MLYLWPLPKLPTAYSSVLFDRQGNLMGASIAADGQWRFPVVEHVPEKLEVAVLTFEDRYYYYHPGINPIAIIRAAIQNFQSGRVKSGASTITMQVARMMHGKKRTYGQKAVEMITALALELRYSKRQILLQYISMAPYGGNVVGINAASWRYFGRPLDQLSWAEAALLAVLPNQPSALYPGRATDALKAKRDSLLTTLFRRGMIDAMELELAVEEPLPSKPYDIPTDNVQLLNTLKKRYGDKLFNTSIDAFWQAQTRRITEKFHRLFMANGVDNVAALVIDLEAATVLAYIGNTNDNEADGWEVDIVQRPRSSGSLLKPLLMAGALDKGLISPTTLLPDIPTFLSGFTPKNFNHGYEGAVPVNQALARSLNIPFVHLLKQYQYEQFQLDLRQSGFTTVSSDPDRYGLSLVLGGAEVTLWDAANVYTSLYKKLQGETYDAIQLMADMPKQNKYGTTYSNAAIWHTLNAMTNLVRPGIDQNWENFSSSQKIAWKTGTSIGFRDAWAVGLNGTVLAAVWVGNADGEGRAGLVGTTTAGAVLLDVLSNSTSVPDWLEKLKPPASYFNICAASGHLAGPYCSHVVEMQLPENASKMGVCPYHHQIFLDSTGTYRVNSQCHPLYLAKPQAVFSLPPSWAYYYRMRHPQYKGAPTYMQGCIAPANPIEIIYPTPRSNIYIPRGAHGKEKVIFQASHADIDNGVIYWHIGDQYLGATKGNHEMTVWLAKGEHLLLLTDTHNNRVSQIVNVVSD